MTRDSQRARVYKAERCLAGFGENEFGSLPNTQKWVDDVLAERWFRSRWNLRGGIRCVAGQGGAAASYGGWITFGLRARNQAVALHEIAHEIIKRDTVNGRSAAGHGSEFCAVLLYLVKQVAGAAEAAKLRASFIEHRVKHRAAGAVPAPRYTVVTQAEQREDRRRRGTRFVSSMEAESAAATVRQLVKQGTFGAAGSKQRAAALAVARRLAAL